MRYYLIATLFFLIAFNGCKERYYNNSNPYLRDSLLKEYFSEIDSLPYYDTTDINYRVLRAYQNSDTALLKSLNSQIKKQNEFIRYRSLRDSCIHQKPLQQLDADEAYRFILLPAFCSTPINVTITKKGDSINLHFLLYQIKFDTASCRIISEYEKKLTSEQWQEFSNKLLLADIWGLKPENGIHGFDGSTITFAAYQKGNPSFNRIDKISFGTRWEFSTLYDPLQFILKISGNKKGCYWIQ